MQTFCSIRFTHISSEVPKRCGDHCGGAKITSFCISLTSVVYGSGMCLTQKNYKVAGKKYTNPVWKCKTKKYKTCISVKKGTCFAKTNGALAVIFSLILVFLMMNIPRCEVVKLLTLKKNLVTNFISFLSYR